MQLVIDVVVSILIVAMVLWFMWRLPSVGEKYYSWAPPMALMSPWTGLAGLVLTGLLWVLPASDGWLPVVFLLLDPVAIGSGVLVLWIYRGVPRVEGTIQDQRIQAWVGLVLGLAAVAVGYVFVMTHKTPFTPVGM